MQKDKKEKLSKKARGILFSFDQEIKNNGIKLDALLLDLFQMKKMTLKHGEFEDLIKQVDYLLPFEDVDYLWDELNQSGKGYVIV